MLKIESLTFKKKQNYLIRNISLEFNSGVYGILGPNGSGKTSLLKTISGLWIPTSGSVLWNGENLLSKNRTEVSRIVSLVPQNSQIHFDFTVQEIVEMGTYPNKNLTNSQKSSIVQWALEIVNIWNLKDQIAADISQGERQRMYIARSLATQSPILLLDEPTSNLDIKHQIDIWKLLKELAGNNKIIIVTTHDLKATQRYCDQVAILDKGTCTSLGSFYEMMTPERLFTTFGVIPEFNY